MSLFNIGPSALAKLWIEREREERVKSILPGGKGNADIVAKMRREMQEACGLIIDPSSPMSEERAL